MKRHIAMLIGMGSLLSACNSDAVENEFGWVASARISGTVMSTAGQPLDYVRVAIDAPGNYADVAAYTNAKGEFSINLKRMLTLEPATTNPDTVRFDVVSTWINGKRADGTYPVNRTRHLVTFAPASPPATVIAVQIPVP